MYWLALEMAFVHTSSGQELTLEGLLGKTPEQSFHHTQKLYRENTKHRDEDLKNKQTKQTNKKTPQ